MYGYNPDGDAWSEIDDFTGIMSVPIADGMNDTHVVVFDAFDYTWVFLAYETAGDVWCRYKVITEEDFSEPLLVSELNTPVALPDIYPNGDVGVVFAWQADDGTGFNQTDIFTRVAQWEEW